MIISSKLYKEYSDLQDSLWKELNEKSKIFEDNNKLLENSKLDKSDIEKLEKDTRKLELEINKIAGKSSILRKFLHFITMENLEENSKKTMLKDMIDNCIDEYFKKESEEDEKQ
jgi:hypothetical protein